MNMFTFTFVSSFYFFFHLTFFKVSSHELHVCAWNFLLHLLFVYFHFFFSTALNADICVMLCKIYMKWRNNDLLTSKTDIKRYFSISLIQGLTFLHPVFFFFSLCLRHVSCTKIHWYIIHILLTFTGCDNFWNKLNNLIKFLINTHIFNVQFSR